MRPDTIGCTRFSVKADILITGGGIVGLATAQAVLQRFPGRRVVVLEKEDHLVAHQTEHNCHIIHSGICHKPVIFKTDFAKLSHTFMPRFAVCTASHTRSTTNTSCASTDW